MSRADLLLALLVCAAGAACTSLPESGDREPGGAKSPEARAIAFLSREVPWWFQQNKCFSCHNNGDAARALYAASRGGYTIPAAALADTTAWLQRPEFWDDNKGDPAFSDKRLARIQFTAALADAIATGHATNRGALRFAAESLLREQHPSGAWQIDPPNALGSPATYGTHLATALAVSALSQIDSEMTLAARRRAEEWLLRQGAGNVLEAAAGLLLLREQRRELRGLSDECLELIRRSQSAEGGWGPYPDAPPEPFDTAVVLLALQPVRSFNGVPQLIASGRKFLESTQFPDGSWPETTRPPRGESYAQRISTTGWATLALLATRANPEHAAPSR